MKADLNIPKVIGVEVAVVQAKEDSELWDVILINRTTKTLENVIIVSKGYGAGNCEAQQTSILRHIIKELPPESCARVEPIQRDVFHLVNEYWVSYYLGKVIYDKKYIFLPDTIHEKNISLVPGFDFKGVVHK